MGKKEVENIIIGTKVNVLADMLYNNIVEMIRILLERGVAIPSPTIADEWVIPLELTREYSNYKGLIVYVDDNGMEVSVVNDERDLGLATIIMEVQMAIYTDLASRYFDVEDI